MSSELEKTMMPERPQSRPKIGDPTKMRDPNDADLQAHEDKWNRWADAMQAWLTDATGASNRFRIELGERDAQIQSLKMNASHFRDLATNLEEELRDEREELAPIRAQRDALAEYVRAIESMKDAEARMRSAREAVEAAIGPALEALGEVEGERF